MHTLTIDGVAIAITDAAREAAEDVFRSDDFLADLRTLTADGRPLWDGLAPLVIRAANEEESDLFEAADFEEPEIDGFAPGEAEEGEGLTVMFLVELDEDTDED